MSTAQKIFKNYQSRGTKLESLRTIQLHISLCAYQNLFLSMTQKKSQEFTSHIHKMQKLNEHQAMSCLCSHL